MSDTVAFVDPVFLDRFGLFRATVLDYFLLHLNPFRTNVNTSNEVLSMQGICIGRLMQQGIDGIPVSQQDAEKEYSKALSRLTGEQYELLPPEDPLLYTQPSPLYTIRHVYRTSETAIKVLGIYYVVEGTIFRAPKVFSVTKSNVAKTLTGISRACSSLSPHACYQPANGYVWLFDAQDKALADPVALGRLMNQRLRGSKTSLVHDNKTKRSIERNAGEEEAVRASESIDQILVRLGKSKMLQG